MEINAHPSARFYCLFYSFPFSVCVEEAQERTVSEISSVRVNFPSSDFRCNSLGGRYCASVGKMRGCDREKCCSLI